MGKLLLLFTLVPLVELYLLLLIGGLIGFWPTVGIVLLTATLGAWLAKSEGLRVLQKWQAALAEGRMPEEGVLGGLLVLVGGVLLVTPGVLTDVTGLLLLFPPTRRFVSARVRAHFEKKISEGTVRVVSFRSYDAGPARRAGGGRVIDVDGETVADEDLDVRALNEPGR